MKGVLILVDGLGDLPTQKLEGKTPLEVAKKPNLDYLASHGKLGLMYPIKKNVTPGSDEAVISILGNRLNISYRGWFETIGAGIKLRRGDLAFRANFATIDNLDNRNIIDRRVGRNLTTKEATILTNDIKNKIKSRKFIFKNTIQHRGVFVLKGSFSENVTGTDLPLYTEKGRTGKFHYSEPLDETENSRFTAEMVNEFVYKSAKILENHPVNINRLKRGVLPANVILLRGPSNHAPELIKYKDWGAIVYMPVEIGISKVSDITPFTFPYPELKGDVYPTLHKGLRKACKFAIKTLKKQVDKFDYFYIHFKETDVPGHDNRPHEKVKMIEELDKLFFKKFKKFAEKNKIKVIITADHSTPCILKDHSADPVPVLYCDWERHKTESFSEKTAEQGTLGKFNGPDLLKKLKFRNR